MSAALLVACGGGGGGDSSGPTNTSAITSTNAQTVTAQALNGSNAVNGGATAGSSLVTGVSVSGDTTARTGMVNVALQQIYKGLDVARPSNLVTGATASQTVACAVSGSMTVNVTYSNANTVSNGDSMAITASNCVETVGEKLNGGFSVMFNNLSGTIGSAYAWSATLGFTFTNFTVEQSTETTGVNGDMTMTYSQTNSLTADSSISGRSMRSTLVKNAVTVIDETLTSYSISDTKTSTLYTETADFTFADNRAATYTAYTVKTIAPFKKTSATAYPYEGAVTITAGNGSKATVTALSSTNVRIDVDSNGDGQTDQTINTTWAALDSLN